MSTPPTLTPQDFVDKWRSATLKERSAYQEHFIDLCRLIGHPTPAEVDPTGENFAFEYGAACRAARCDCLANVAARTL